MNTKRTFGVSVAVMAALWVGTGAAFGQEAKPGEKAEGSKVEAPASTQPVRVDVTKKEQIDAAIGKEAVVVGTVESARWTATGKTLIMTFKGAPEEFRLRGYGENREELDKAFGGDVAQHLIGKKVEVTGPVTKYTGSVEHWRHHTDVTVRRAGQIKVVKGNDSGE